MTRLADYIERLERLSAGSFIDRVRRTVALDGLRLINKGYATSTDPYGNRWQPLKYRKGKPLVKTGAFRDTWLAYPTATGVRFVSGVGYGAYHQYGTATIPFRRVVPLTRYGLPKAWTDAINAAFTSAARQAVAA